MKQENNLFQTPNGISLLPHTNTHIRRGSRRGSTKIIPRIRLEKSDLKADAGARRSSNTEKPRGEKKKTMIPKIITGYKVEDEIFLVNKDMKKIDTYCGLFVVLGLLVSMYENDIFFGNGNQGSTFSFLLRSIVFFTCFCASFSL